MWQDVARTWYENRCTADLQNDSSLKVSYDVLCYNEPGNKDNMQEVHEESFWNIHW